MEYYIKIENIEQATALESFLKSVKIKFVKAKPTQAELEAKLLPKQREVWENLKTALKEVENGKAEGMSWEDFKKELANENTIVQTV